MALPFFGIGMKTDLFPVKLGWEKWLTTEWKGISHWISIQKWSIKNEFIPCSKLYISLSYLFYLILGKDFRDCNCFWNAFTFYIYALKYKWITTLGETIVFFLIFIYLAAQVLIAACNILDHCGMWTLSYNMWDLNSHRDQTWAPALQVWSLSHWTTRDIPVEIVLNRVHCFLAPGDTIKNILLWNPLHNVL